MIYIDKTPHPIPEILTASDKSGKKETNRNIEFINKNEPENLKFNVYSNPKVKDSLIDLFNGKCAYCESKFLHVYSGDIEHFRPKGEILTKDNITLKPGYYWLAADWGNLLLSCRNCNQKLKHLIVGETNKKTMGKMNQFPLTDSTKYVLNHNFDIADEENYRLLIQPCIDNPEEHLEFDINNGIIRGITEKGKKSIEVYVLQRIPLVQSREKLLIDIKAQIQRVIDAVNNVNDNLDTANSSKRLYFDKILKREMKRLKKYLNPEEEYIAMAKQIIIPFLKSNFGIIN